jgi:hypothetical protein
MKPTVDLASIVERIDLKPVELERNLVGLLAETRAAHATPEIFFGAVVGSEGSLAAKRIRCQGIDPRNIVAVIQSCQINEAVQMPRVTRLRNAPASRKLNEFCEDAARWLQETGSTSISEQALLPLLFPYIGEEAIESLRRYGMLDWSTFAGSFKQASEPITLWDSDGRTLRLETAFDKSGKRTLTNLRAETIGLGFRNYGVEALFIALLSDTRSALTTAMLTDPGQKLSPAELAGRLRNQMKRPKLNEDPGEIRRDNCQPRLIGILEMAAEIARTGGGTVVTGRDLAEALLVREQHSGLGKVLEHLGVAFSGLIEIVECHDQEAEDSLPGGKATRELEERINQRIIGQDHAVHRIMPLIKRLKFGYRRPGKPAGVFLFMGPSGTGKTMMAKVLAETLYGDAESLLMLEMGQFGSKESKSMFIGAPPGYVGYGEGKLTNGIRDNPECVILFDEVDKADPLVLDVLLRFLDEGQIDDPSGPVRDGSRCLIVLTSNFLADRLERYEAQLRDPDPRTHDAVYRSLRKELLDIGQASGDEKVKKFFRPEFLFRIDETILFRPFTLDDYRRIAELEIAKECAYIMDRYNIRLDCDASVVELISRAAEERKDEGARVINRLVNVHVVNEFIDYLTEHRLAGGNRLSLRWDAGSRRILVEGGA